MSAGSLARPIAEPFRRLPIRTALTMTPSAPARAECTTNCMRQ
jgi:hypothetical protein